MGVAVSNEAILFRGLRESEKTHLHKYVYICIYYNVLIFNPGMVKAGTKSFISLLKYPDEN
tara:strand:+ start:788 stop:970 length:183 start_codon:yes stop_codon:yes gene_type:complete